jgi:lactoylglutathione lyase
MKRLLPTLLLLTCTTLIHNNPLMAQSPRVNHMAFYVTDLNTSTVFYRDIIGLDTIPEPFHDKNTHLCFSVASVTDFMARLNSHHIEFENWVGEKGVVTNRVDGVKQIYFKDPDGYWIEINDAK